MISSQDDDFIREVTCVNYLYFTNNDAPLYKSRSYSEPDTSDSDVENTNNDSVAQYVEVDLGI